MASHWGIEICPDPSKSNRTIMGPNEVWAFAYYGETRWVNERKVILNP